jgi:hypothetical protein
MASATEATQSAQPERPGTRDGVANEFLILADLKPGHADALREEITGYQTAEATAARRAAFQEIATLHDARHVILDDGTRFLFASVFDGSWDAYIDDFGSLSLAEGLDRIFSHCEGFPGIKDPSVKEWLVAHQVPALFFFSGYPDLTVKQIWKDQEVNEAFQEVLDTPEFREVLDLDHPATAALRATPAFQRLLDKAAG